MAKRGRRRGSTRVVSARPPSTPRVRRTSWREASRYVGKWHVVYDWASEVIGLADEVAVSLPNPRVQKRRAMWVADVNDAEEAYERGTGLEEMLFPRGPTQTEGGRRRVLVRAYTWTVDETAGSVYEPLWITLGVGHTARQATDAAWRYVRGYAFALNRGIESRKLVVTAVEVTWWTAAEGTDYV